MSSVVTCKLNSAYQRALEGNHFKFKKNHKYIDQSSWSYYEIIADVLYDPKTKTTIKVDDILGALQCCGINELLCTSIQTKVDEYIGTPQFPELIAKYIKYGLKNTNDKRILIIGIPVKVGTNSMYNIKFYEALRETLEDFGFKQVGQQYKNQNSKNTIVVMVGQLP